MRHVSTVQNRAAERVLRAMHEALGSSQWAKLKYQVLAIATPRIMFYDDGRVEFDHTEEVKNICSMCDEMIEVEMRAAAKYAR